MTRLAFVSSRFAAMFGLRYHIVTVVSMLLMLGIGILFGSTSGVGSNAVKSQTKLLANLNGKLNSMAVDDERERALLKQNQDAISLMTPSLVAGKLAHRRVSVIQLGDYPAAVESASSAVVLAGGTVVSTITVSNKLPLLDEPTRRTLAGPNLSLATLYHSLSTAYRLGTAQRSDAQVGLDALQSNNIIAYSGDFTQPVSGVVVVGGWIDDPNVSTASPQGNSAPGYALSNADEEVGLIEALNGGGPLPLTVVGCEESDVGYSSVNDFVKAGIASVDCIDLPIGALDLPFALDGQRGEYGVKSQATLLVPQALRTGE